MTINDPTQIHDSVRERYAAIARNTGAGCGCGCNDTAADCCQTNLYDPTLIADLPVDVTGLSLGCGDPVTIASLQPGERVLDLGSGGGIDCFLAAKQVGETGYVIGVDMTPEMILRANTSRIRMGVQNVEFRRGQIENLPVQDNSIDVVMSNCVINLSPDKLSVFREAFRVLKPGGRMAFSDIVTEGHFTEEQRADMQQWTGCVSGAMDVTEFTSLIKAAGFEDVQVVDKVAANEVVTVSPGMPRVFSARITARKPS
jgi:SAM-dependent methyltransferase